MPGKLLCVMCRLLFDVLLVPMKNFDHIKNRGCMYFACLIYFCWILIFCLHRTWEYASCSPLKKSLVFIFLCLHWQDIFDTCLFMQTDILEEPLFEHGSAGSQSPELHCFWSHLLCYWHLSVPESLIQQVKINLQSIPNVTGGRWGHKYKRKDMVTVIDGMTVT